MDDKYAQYKRLNEIEHLDPKGFNLTGTQYFLIYMNQLNLSSWIDSYVYGILFTLTSAWRFLIPLLFCADFYRIHKSVGREEKNAQAQ